MRNQLRSFHMVLALIGAATKEGEDFRVAAQKIKSALKKHLKQVRLSRAPEEPLVALNVKMAQLITREYDGYKLAITKLCAA